MRAQNLLAFFEYIGIDPIPETSVDSQVETLEEYRVVKRVSTKALSRLTDDACSFLTDAFGDSLSLSIGIANAQPLFEVNNGNWPDNLTAALQTVHRFDVTVDLTLVIDKLVALRRLGIVENHCRCLYYLFHDRLVAYLESPLTELDASLFTDLDQPTVIVLSELDIEIRGQLLSIVGEDRLPVDEVFAPASNAIKSRVTHFRETAAEQLSWTGFRLKRLTPLHFLCAQQDTEKEALSTVLARHTLHLGVLYTANRSHLIDNYRFDSSYVSPDHSATVALRRDDLAPANRILARFAVWPYGGSRGDSDRLLVLQHVLARELTSDDGVGNTATLSNRLEWILGEVRWHYRLFLEGEIGKHFEYLQKMTDYVVDTTKKVADAVDLVTKGLTDAALATVGVIIVALLTSLSRYQQQGRIVTITMLLYGGYLVFLVPYRLGSIWHSTTLLKVETQDRLNVFRSVLGDQKVNDATRPVVSRLGQFYFWFWVTLSLYVGFAIAIWILGPRLPSIVSSSATAVPPTPTP